jgi:hypothetical protein
MIRSRLFATVLCLGAFAGMAHASVATYIVTLNTPDFGVPGFIDLAFNEFTASSLSATAYVSNFQETGYTFNGNDLSSPGGTGGFGFGWLTIPNDQGAANYYDIGVASWGSFFRFSVTFSGPAVGNVSPDGSNFLVTLFDENFIPLVAPLPLQDVAEVVLNADGTISTAGSTFAGGSATVSPAPEPGTWLLGAASGLLLIARKIRQVR